MKPAQDNIPPPPRQYTRAMIRTGLKCRRCGYDLRGLSLDGACPECGLEIWQTISREIDPKTSYLPPLVNPRSTGNGLLMLTLCMLCAAVVVMLGPLAAQLHAWDSPLAWQLDILISQRLPYYSGLLALVGLWPLWKLMPRRGDAAPISRWRDIRLIGFGLIGWAAVMLLLGSLFSTPDMTEMRWSAFLVAYGFAVISFLGLRGIFHLLGERSRAYRQSRGGRQNLGTLIAALLGIVCGHVLHLLHEGGLFGEYARVIGMIISGISGFMLIFGLFYLVLNAWWIRQAIARPPRDLHDLLRILPDDELIPPPQSPE